MKLNTPYPFPNKTQKLFFVFGLSFFVFSFLAVFEPFGIDNIEQHQTLILLGYGLITLVITLLSFFVAPVFFPTYFDSENWTVKKAFVFFFWGLFIIAVLNWQYTLLIRDFLETREFTFSQFVFYTVAVGVLGIFFLILISERLLNYFNALDAKKWTTILTLQVAGREEENLLVKLGMETNSIHLDLKNLLCIKSAGNYSEVYYLEQETHKKELLRCPLSLLKQQLDAYAFIKQCHRSYIVNFNRVTKINGNARNYSLECKALDFPIPVSRQFPKKMLTLLDD